MEKSYLTTREGLEKMKQELEELKNVRRPEISERIAKAKELGDLSENAEYHEAKEAMGWLGGRVMELEAFIVNANVIEPQAGDAVSVGCSVTCEFNGKKKTFHIVGSNETDPATGRISDESPLGSQLIGRKKGESFDFKAPSGPVTYLITDITC